MVFWVPELSHNKALKKNLPWYVPICLIEGQEKGTCESAHLIMSFAMYVDSKLTQLCMSRI